MSTEERRCHLELLVLRTLAITGRQHGLGLARRIFERPAGLLDVNQGTLYPALLRLEQRRWIRSRWGLDDHDRQAKFFELTPRGRRRVHCRHGFTGSVQRVSALPRSATVMLAATLLSPMSQDHRHARASAARILALIEMGIRRSPTFRHLVDVLDTSDVIVYIETKRTRDALDGYLTHNIVAAGGFRYLHVAIVTQGAEDRLIAVLAHELQHAVEVVHAPEVRDPESLAKMFSRVAIPFGCDGSTCYETQASKEVEYAVRDELKAARTSRLPTLTASAAPEK
jgi:PadR family transcriptional regulator